MLCQRGSVPRDFSNPLVSDRAGTLTKKGGVTAHVRGMLFGLEMSLLRAWVGSEFSWKGFPPRCGGGCLYKGMRALFSSFVGKVH